jgi:hypothetical protein
MRRKPRSARFTITDGPEFFPCSSYNRAKELFLWRCKIQKPKERLIRTICLDDDGNIQICNIARIEPMS